VSLVFVRGYSPRAVSGICPTTGRTSPQGEGRASGALRAGRYRRLRRLLTRRAEGGRLPPGAPGVTGAYEQPLVSPQLSHFKQTPFRTSVNAPQFEHGSPS